jgi:hypothetical protein
VDLHLLQQKHPKLLTVPDMFASADAQQQHFQQLATGTEPAADLPAPLRGLAGCLQNLVLDRLLYLLLLELRHLHQAPQRPNLQLLLLSAAGRQLKLLQELL